jgi:hypothetical protein
MQKLSTLTVIPLIAAITLSVSHSANAFDLTGAWANDVSVCNKVFQRSGQAIRFRDDSEAFGSGFIFEKDRVRGKAASCVIKNRKEESKTIQLIAVCSTDVALSTLQLSLKIIDDNNITRVFPGIEELNVKYTRCPLEK